MNGLVITQAVEYSDLNPCNYALKNTYVTNLLTTAIATLPVIEKITGSIVSVTRGFESKQCLVSSRPNLTSLEYKFGEGLALEIRVDPYDHNLILAALKRIIQDNNASFKFVIKKGEERVVIYRIKKTSQISEELSDEERIVFADE